jgi:hypothetical protein
MLKPVKSVYDKFYQEFGFLNNRINIILLSIDEAKESQESEIAMPGVYVFWRGNEIIKVGRHLLNSRKRALEHLGENTSYDQDQKALFQECFDQGGIVLINCKNAQDYHWTAAIEMYLERELQPRIMSKRTG